MSYFLSIWQNIAMCPLAPQLQHQVKCHPLLELSKSPKSSKTFFSCCPWRDFATHGALAGVARGRVTLIDTETLSSISPSREISTHYFHKYLNYPSIYLKNLFFKVACEYLA
jgi:hypothetical protein